MLWTTLYWLLEYPMQHCPSEKLRHRTVKLQNKCPIKVCIHEWHENYILKGITNLSRNNSKLPDDYIYTNKIYYKLIFIISKTIYSINIPYFKKQPLVHLPYSLHESNMLCQIITKGCRPKDICIEKPHWGLYHIADFSNYVQYE